MKSHNTEINGEYSTTQDIRGNPEPADEGKDVVDAEYREIGMVTDVYNNTLYVDPNTSITTTVKRKLGWSDKRRSDHPIPPQCVMHINVQVVLPIKRDEDFQPELR